MSKDLSFGRLSNSEKDVLLNISKQYSLKKQQEINIKEINFVDFEGKPIAKSTLYKVLKNLCDKNLISHLGSERSSTYKLN
jgi:predicted transcriptional regulator